MKNRQRTCVLLVADNECSEIVLKISKVMRDSEAESCECFVQPEGSLMWLLRVIVS